MAILANFKDTNGLTWNAVSKPKESVPVWLCNDQQTYTEIALVNDIPCVKYSNGSTIKVVTSSQIVEAFYESSTSKNTIDDVFSNGTYGIVGNITDEQLKTLREAIDFPINLLPIAFDGSLSESSERMVKVGDDVLIDDTIKYFEVFDTLGVNNGLTMTLLKNEDTANTELVKRRALSALDIVLDNHKFIRTSTLDNSVPRASDLGVSLQNVGTVTSDVSESLGYGSGLSKAESYSLISRSSGFSTSKSGVLLKGYAKSALEFLKEDTGASKPHLFICRDGKILVLRPFSDNVVPDSFVPNDSIEPNDLGNLIVVGVESRNPFEVTTGRYFSENEMESALTAIDRIIFSNPYKFSWGTQSSMGTFIPATRNDGSFYSALVATIKPFVRNLDEILLVNKSVVSYDTSGENEFEFDTWKLSVSRLPTDLTQLSKYFKQSVPADALANWNKWRQPKGLSVFSIAKEELTAEFSRTGTPEISEAIRKINIYLDSVPQPFIDYSNWFEMSKGDTVSMVHQRESGLTEFQKQYCLTVPSDRDRQKYLQAKLAQSNPFTPYINTKFALDLSYGDWYFDNSNTIVQDYNLATIYGSEDEVSTFGQSSTGGGSEENMARAVGMRSTYWNDIFSKRHLKVDDRGRDLYQLTEDAQVADKLISEFSTAYDNLHANITFDVITGIDRIREIFSTSSKISQSITKTSENFEISFNHVNARTLTDVMRFCFESSNYYFSKKSGLSVGRSQAFPSFNVRKNLKYTSTEAIIPDWDREVVSWIGGSLQSPYINFDLLRSVSLESEDKASRRLSIRLLRDELVSEMSETNNFDPYPEDVNPTFTDDGKLFVMTKFSEFKGTDIHFFELGETKSSYLEFASAGLYSTKNFEENYNEIVLSKKVPDLDSSANHSEITKGQSKAFKSSNYFKGEAWKVMNPNHQDIFEVATNSRRWFSSRLTDNSLDAKTGSKFITNKTAGILAQMGLLKIKSNLGISWSPTDINHWNPDMTQTGAVPMKSLISLLAPAGSVNETSVEKIVNLFAGIGGNRSESLVSIGNPFTDITSNSHQPIDTWNGEMIGSSAKQSDLSKNWGWLTYHLMTPFFSGSQIGNHLPIVMSKNEKLIYDMVGDKSIYDVTAKNSNDRMASDIVTCLVHEYEKIFAMDERIRSYHVGQSFWWNISKPAIWSVNIPSAFTLASKFGKSTVVDGKTIPPKPILTFRADRNTIDHLDTFLGKNQYYEYIVNEDPHKLFTLQKFCVTGDITKSSNGYINNDYTPYHTYLYTGVRSNEYNVRVGGSYVETNDSFVTKKFKNGFKSGASGTWSMVTHLQPFRPSMNSLYMLSAQNTDDWSGTDKAMYTNCDIIQNSPFFKGFYGNVVIADNGEKTRTTNLNRPVYVSKMPREYCISPEIRDAIYEAYSNTTAVNYTGAIVKQDASVITFVASRAIHLWHDHFVYFVKDLSENLANLSYYLSGGLFGDQVIGGTKISSFAGDVDAVDKLSKLIDGEALARMNQRFASLTTPNDYPFQGIHNDSIYKIDSYTDKMAGIAMVLYKMEAVYEIILELKNSAFHVKVDSGSSKKIMVIGDVKNPKPITLGQTMDFLYSNFFQSIPEGLNKLKAHITSVTNPSLALDFNSGTFEALNEVQVFHVPRTVISFPDGSMLPYNPTYFMPSTNYIATRSDLADINGVYNDSRGQGTAIAVDDIFYPNGFWNTKFGGSSIGSSSLGVGEADLWYASLDHGGVGGRVRLCPNGTVYRSDVISKWTVDQVRNSWDKTQYPLTSFILTGIGYYSVSGVCDSFNFKLQPILKAYSDIPNYYDTHQRYSILSNYRIHYSENMTYKNFHLIANLAWEISWGLESSEGVKVSKLAYLSGSFTETKKISDGFKFEPLTMTQINSTNYDAILNILLLTSQIYKWQKRKLMAVDSMIKFDEVADTMISSTGFSEWKRGFRFFARPTIKQTESLGIVINTLGCVIPNLTWIGTGDEFKGNEIVDAIEEGNRNYIFTTDCVSKKTIEFGLHWFEAMQQFGFFSSWGSANPFLYSGFISAIFNGDVVTYPDRVIQHNRQPYSLITDADEILSGRPKYRVFYGNYKAPNCQPDELVNLPSKSSTTTTSPDCSPIVSNSKSYGFSNASYVVPWKTIFEKSLDEIKIIGSETFDFSAEHKYVDTTNAFGVLVSPAEDSMKDALQ